MNEKKEIGKNFKRTLLGITIALSFFSAVMGQESYEKPWEVVSYQINGTEVPLLSGSTRKEFDAKELGHDVGFLTSTGWAVKPGDWNNLQRGDGGYLAKGAYYKQSGFGGVRAVFRLKIDDNTNGVWDKIMRLELYDSIRNQVISHQVIERNYFRGKDKFQNFVLHADLAGKDANNLEARVWYLGKAHVEIEKIVFIIDQPLEGLPVIINRSSADDKHVEKLLIEAIKGLGFSDYQGPNANDLVFVNNYYMAWVDQTGYYGKMNGLWLLNNKNGHELNFNQKTRKKDRVVNFLVVAEEGSGEWPGSYMGAEHFEIPSYVKENDDVATPVEPGISNWYTLNEANQILGTGGTGHIPWWTCCSGVKNNKQSFWQMNPSSEFDLQDDHLKINYLAPLTKGVDADGTYDGDKCQANLLFYNNIRYPVYLRLGYVFYDDKPYWDRTYQVFNPNENPTLRVNTFWAIIHGILITRTPYSIDWKANLFSYIYPSQSGMVVQGSAAPKNSWSGLDTGTETDLIGGLGAPHSSFTISDNKTFDAGHSFYFGFYSESEKAGNDGNISFCKCVVHGNWEIGGGIINNKYPIPGGQNSEKLIRRLGFPQGKPIGNNSF